MDQLTVLTWAIGGGFAGTWGILFFMFSKIEKLDEKITDIDRRLCRLEGAFTYSQERPKAS